MVDLIRDATMKELLKAFAHDKKCVGLICHAPALLTVLPEEENPYEGYKINCITGLEKFFIEKFVMKGKPFNRKMGKQLKKLGFNYVKGGPAKNVAVRDR